MSIRKIQLYGFALLAIFTMAAFSGTASASLITAEKIVELANNERASQDLPGLVINADLAKAAEDKLADMFKKNYFEHTSPAGLTPWHWLEKNNYEYKYAGENLAMNFVSAENQHKAWMESPTHRANILNTRYQEIGVAVGQGSINGRETIVAVEEFGARADFAPVPAKKVESQESPQKTPTKPQAVNDGKPRVLADNLIPAAGKFLGAWKGKIIESNFGVYAMAGALAGVGYLTAFNFMILAYLMIESKRKVLAGNKYQILYTVTPEEYEDLMRGFKARARGMYEAHFDKIHLKMSS
ncbi:MAG: CAP domain-containing protein [Parcubacteria group bacterium]